MFPDPAVKENWKQVSRYRLQYQTRRAMFTALEEMLECRKRGDLAKLIKMVEREIDVRYQIKSSKVMTERKNSPLKSVI
jgi:hypothetical protein